jgi:hypothetical protein
VISPQQSSSPALALNTCCASGVILRCSQELGSAAYEAVASAGGMDFDGLDMVVAGIEPFSEVVLGRGAEPTLLGYKRQGILLSTSADDIIAGVTPGSSDALVMSVANAPGLPPVVGVALVTADEEAAIHAPEGFDIIQVCPGACSGPKPTTYCHSHTRTTSAPPSVPCSRTSRPSSLSRRR